jgi:hypothetical protein
MAKEEDDIKTLADALKDVDWLVPDGFYRSTVKFGDKDRATIVCVDGTLAYEAMQLIGEVGGSITSLGESDDVGAALGTFAQLCQDETLDKLWDLICALFHQCVTELHLPEWASVSGKGEPGTPPSDMSSNERNAFVRALPLKVTGRVIAGVLAQLGN